MERLICYGGYFESWIGQKVGEQVGIIRSRTRLLATSMITERDLVGERQLRTSGLGN